MRAGFKPLSAARLTVKLGESEIARATVKYLRKVVRQGKVSTKVETITELPDSTNCRELERLLDITGPFVSFTQAVASQLMSCFGGRVPDHIEKHFGYCSCSLSSGF